ncbi:phage tail tape measure protein [Lactococcus nasutitermitis]|uniref:Phage tail tape measure protein n=1 Tax=Lactococcus nasutitermitis TaxID=1652957 RepID=A0ABV9JDX5_9LACT|nr:phage tail tape measure protein [Lactococcus nasutitermitis]
MADTPLGKMIIEMGLDDTKFSKGITGINKQLTTLKSDLKTSQTAFSTFGKGMDGLASPTEVLNKLIQTQVKQLDKLKASYKNSFVDGKASSSTQKYAGDISRANAQLMQYTKQLKEAAAQQYAQTSILPKMSSGLSTVSKGFGSIAQKSLPASIAVTGALYKGVQAATDFNGEMTTIQSLLSDSTPAHILSQNMETLSTKSKRWARQYGLDTSSINAGFEELIKKGYSFNQAMGAMPAILDASKASGEDFNTVMGSSTSILEQFGLKSNNTQTMLKNTQQVTDSLSFVANKTASGFSDLGEAMEYVGPVAHSLGLNIDETSAAIGLLSNNGVEGESAGTGLRSVLSSLLKPSKQSAEAMKTLGISTADFKKGTIGLPDVIDDVKKSTAGMTDAQRTALITQAFGIKGQTSMNVLVSQGGDALRNLTKETDNATGYTKKLADQMNASDKNAFARAKATLQTLAIDLGEKVLPAILPVVKQIDDLAGGFEKLDPGTQKAILDLGLVVAAAYPVSKALSSVTGAASLVTGGLAKLGEKGAAKLALKGIETGAMDAAGAVAGGGGLVETLGTLSPVLAGIGPVALGTLGVAGLTGLIIGVGKVVGDAEEKMKYFGTVNVPKETVQEVETFKGKVDDLKNATIDFGKKGKGAFTDVKQAIDNLAQSTNGEIDKSTQKMIDAAKDLGYGDDVINKIKNGGAKAKDTVKESADAITKVYQNAKDANGKYRELDLVEQAQVATSEQKIMAQEVDALGVTGNKKKALMTALTGDISKISYQQAQDYQSSIEQTLQKSNDVFAKKQAENKKLLQNGTITQQEYQAKDKELVAAHEATGQAYLNTLKKVIMIQGQGLVEGTTQWTAWHAKAEQALSGYKGNLDDLLNSSGTAIDAITATSASLKTWNSIPDKVKNLLANNTNFKNNEAEASQILTAWNLATPKEKELTAKNLATNPTMSAQAIINSLHGNTVGLFATDKTGNAVNAAAVTISKLQGKTVNLDADASQAKAKYDAFMNLPGAKTINLIANSPAKNATGNPYFEGGLAWVNDQKGSTYKEMITLPTGQSFVPEGRDVILPLPKGTNILKASETAKLIPKYANGTGGFPANAQIFKTMQTTQQRLSVSAPVNVPDNTGQFSVMIALLEQLVKKETTVVIPEKRAMTPREANKALNQLSQQLAYMMN